MLPHWPKTRPLGTKSLPSLHLFWGCQTFSSSLDRRVASLLALLSVLKAALGVVWALGGPRGDLDPFCKLPAPLTSYLWGQRPADSLPDLFTS